MHCVCDLQLKNNECGKQKIYIMIDKIIALYNCRTAVKAILKSITTNIIKGTEKWSLKKT